MNIIQLQYFEKVATLGSVTKAAAELGISASQLSKSISRLEAEIGTQLFDHVGRSIRVNQQGIIFLNSVKKILYEINSCSRQIRYHSDSFSGCISVCIMGPVIHPAITQSIIDFSEKYKSISFAITTYKEDNLTSEELSSFDFVISRSKYLPKNFDGIKLTEDSTCALMSYQHPLASRPAISLEDLKDSDIIVSHFIGAEESDTVYNMFQINSVTPNIRVVIDDNSSVDESIFKHILITSGRDFVGIVPSSYRCIYEHNTDFVFVPITNHMRSRTWDTFFAWNKTKMLSPTATEFLNFVRVNIVNGE